MDFLRTFIALNDSLIIFAYGLAFFVLGLAIALQSRRHSLLDLAISFVCLFEFGASLLPPLGWARRRGEKPYST